MKILLFGKNGQVGWELQRSLAPLGDVMALDRGNSPFWGDLCQTDALAETVRAVRPDVVVNAAAYTAVDKAESEPEQARAINALAPSVLAREAAAIGAWMVHYSTDYVFDGSGSQPWRESDRPAPLNVYGQTKLEGEHLVAQHSARHLILRTSWVYSARGGNFAKTMLRLAQDRDLLTVVNDQFGAPTSAELLADVTAHAIKHLQRQPEHAGLYHLAAGGHTNWFLYAKEVLALAKAAGFAMKTDADAVQAVPSSAFAAAAKRPHNSRLDTRRLQSTFGLTLPPWQQGVARMLAEII